ncbi:LpxL/LpxP family acyltransferase [Aurantivibrio plasticivorans]
MSNKAWDEIEENSNVRGMKILLWVYSVFGRFVFSCVLLPVMFFYFVVEKQARSASTQFLCRVIPSLRERPVKKYWMSFRHFVSFAFGLLDKLALWSGKIKTGPVSYHGGAREDFLKHIESGRGGLMLTCHIGNVEAGRLIAGSHRRAKLNILVHTKHAEKFNSLLNEMDENSALNLLQVTGISPGTAIDLNARVERGESVVIAADRTPVGGGDRQAAVNFMGETAYLPEGPYILASLLRCPVYFVMFVREGDHFCVVIEKFADTIKLSRKTRDVDLQQWAQRYADRLEYYAKQYPMQWFNFYDFWRTSDVEAPLNNVKEVRK